MSTQYEIIEAEKPVTAQNYSPLPVVLTRGEGVYVWDTEGNQYTDMMSAYSAVSFGHQHPRITQALTTQAHRLTIVSRAFYTDRLGPFLTKLCSLAHMDAALPMNTGAEAVETAIKAARLWGYSKKKTNENQAEIIVAKNNFHGRTTTLISCSTEPLYRKGFGPFTPGFKAIEFGNARALEEAITPNTCAFLVEPIQGEGGIIVPPAGWLKEVQAICKKHNILLILDEVQSGLGRTGKTFAYMHDISPPDGLIVGKALGGGILPVSAFLAKHEVMDVFTTGTHGSTFGGNPLAAAVGLEALTVLEEEKLAQKSAVMGEYFMSELKKINSPLIKTVRGRGLWIGVEIDPHYTTAKHICLELLKRRILAKDTHEVVVRFAPPLTITKVQLDYVLTKFHEILQQEGNTPHAAH
jgi:ornithine--oxo-acid transaminase